MLRWRRGRAGRHRGASQCFVPESNRPGVDTAVGLGARDPYLCGKPSSGGGGAGYSCGEAGRCAFGSNGCSRGCYGHCFDNGCCGF